MPAAQNDVIASHGVAMLGIDGQLAHRHADARELIQYAVTRLRPALAPG